jgi:hypothetical protein
MFKVLTYANNKVVISTDLSDEEIDNPIKKKPKNGATKEMGSLIRTGKQRNFLKRIIVKDFQRRQSQHLSHGKRRMEKQAHFLTIHNILNALDIDHNYNY